MGKSRRTRGKAPRADPIAKPVKPPSDPELAALRESKVLPVLNDLKSPDAKSRTAAAGAIANIVQDPRCRKLLLREQIVHTVLTETLTDSSIDSRAAGWEILKVLAQEEEADFCVHLYRVDVLTAIEHAAKAIVETLTSSEQPFKKLTKAQQRLVWDITGSLLSLLGNLAVARDEILIAIAGSQTRPGNQTIVQFLFRLVSTDSAPQEILDETLSCLMTLSEDNLHFGQVLIGDDRCYDELLKLSSSGGSRAALACGVLHNIFTSLHWLDHSPGKDGACDAVLIPSLTRILEQYGSTNGSKANGHQGSFEMVQVALEVLASIGTDLQGALEKGNRPAFSEGIAKADEEWNGIDDADAMDVDEGGSDKEEDEDEDDEGEDDEEDDESDDDDDDDSIGDIEADMEKVTGADDGLDPEDGLDGLPTLREYVQKAIPQLIRLTNPAIIDSDEALTIQGHALSALNNIAWTVSVLDFEEPENAAIRKAWKPAAQRIWSKTITPILEADNADIDLATMVASLAWALSRTLGSDTPLASPREHRKFMSLYQASKKAPKGEQQGEEKEDPLQGLDVKCIGVLGSLARDPVPVALNREIGVFLLTLLNSEGTQPAEAVEALNQLFDIYGDEDAECDKAVFWRDNFLQHLEEMTPKIKAMVKTIDKRQFGELRTKADEAVLNLGRFIQYKKKHKPPS
ncbi:synchronized import protein 1 [Diplogelasinospora grovesii]|uniref:Synchronized import protein 1 n=1 Tax=Diplogelasinospora grovesii TaxID=303347 RepID=A0AAN6S905_9PEZI|nr:synchronized import protein 1 [Diplogelasinospora grovesii]